MEEKKREKEIQFESLKQDLLAELNKKKIVDEPTELIEGFANQPLSSKISNSIVIGGPTIPMIMLLGKDTGRMYLFALKAILKGDLTKYEH